MSSQSGLDLLPDELLLEAASYFNAREDMNARRHVVALAGTSRRAHRVLRDHPEFTFPFNLDVDLAMIPDDSFDPDEMGDPLDLRAMTRKLEELVEARVPIHAILALKDETREGPCDNSEWEMLIFTIVHAIWGGHVVRLVISVTALTGLEALDEVLSVAAPELTELRVSLKNDDDVEHPDPVLPIFGSFFNGQAPLLRSVSFRGVALPPGTDMSAFRDVQSIERNWFVGSRWDMRPDIFPCVTRVRLFVVEQSDLLIPEPPPMPIAEAFPQVRHLTIIFENIEELEHTDNISKWTRYLFPNLDSLELTAIGASPWRRTISIGEIEALDFIDEYIPWESDGLIEMTLSRLDEPAQVVVHDPNWDIPQTDAHWHAFKLRKHVSVAVQRVLPDEALGIPTPTIMWDTEEKFMDDLSTYHWLAKRIVSIWVPYDLIKFAALFVRGEVAELYPRLQQICVDVVGFTHRVRPAKVFDKLATNGVPGIQNDEKMVWSIKDGVPEHGPTSPLQLVLFTSNGAQALVPKLLPSRIASRLQIFPRFECIQVVLQNVRLVDNGPSGMHA